MDDFELSCKGLYRALTIREKYMRLAYQRYPLTTSQYLRDIESEPFHPEDTVQPRKQTRWTVFTFFFFLFYCEPTIFPHLHSTFSHLADALIQSELQ